MSPLTVLVAVGVFVYLIGQQVMGSAVRGRRLILLPAVLTVAGIVEISGGKPQVGPLDVALLAVGAVTAVTIGLGLGAMTRVERRGGYLWTQLPKQGLWLWGGLIASRLIFSGIAEVSGAHVAAGSGAILLTLGLNRAAQALVVGSRAVAAGIPFAPEKDGRVFAGSLFSGAAQ